MALYITSASSASILQLVFIFSAAANENYKQITIRRHFDGIANYLACLFSSEPHDVRWLWCAVEFVYRFLEDG